MPSSVSPRTDSTSKGYARVLIFLVFLTVQFPGTAVAVASTVFDDYFFHAETGSIITVTDMLGNELRLEILAPDLVRVRYGFDGSFPHDRRPEYEVVKSVWPPVPYQLEDHPETLVITTEKLRFELSKSPLQLSLFNTEGRLLFKEFAPGMDPSQRGVQAALSLHADEHIFGFGDKRTPLDKRGQVVEVWNTDAYGSTGDNGYKSLPFYLSTRGYGLYLHTRWRSRFDLGATDPSAIHLEADGGELDFYLFYGPSFKTILDRYTELTGRPSLPPMWAFGFEQGKSSYRNEDEVLAVARELRRREIPADILYIDDWATYEQKWDLERFPNPAGMIAELGALGFKVSAGLGLPFADEAAELYDRAADEGHLVVDDRSQSASYPLVIDEDTDGAHLDFSSDAAADFWFENVFAGPLEDGISSFMLDFGESVPPEVVFPHTNRSGEELHNVFGLLYGEKLIERAAELMNSRKIGLVRSGYAGSQRAGWTWTADSFSQWDYLLPHLRAVQNLGLGGFAFVGQDIGGWDGDDGEEAAAPPPSPELYTRWFEIGVFNALTRAHGTSAREPYQFGQEVEQITKDYLRLRYRLLPYIYTSAWQASQTGVPLVRPLVLEFQNDPTTYVRDDEFLFGPSLLVAPVTTLGASSREVYLPEGLWYDFWEPTQTFRGPTTLTEVAAPLGRVPLFVRGGAVIPMGPEMNYVGEQPLDPLELHIYPDQTARGLLYEDDGVSPEGSYSTTNYNLIQGETLRLDVDRRTGLFRPQERTYRVILYDRDEPTAVARDGSRVAEVASHLELQTVSYGWFYDASARVLHLAFPDTGAATQWEVR